MAPATDDHSTSDPATARAEAAGLFAAAARNELAGTAAQLHCLAAASALRVPSGPVPAITDVRDPDQLITQALHILGELEPEDFAHPDVLAAARHGRRALREPR